MKKYKKVMSTLLALTLCLNASLPVFAEENDTENEDITENVSVEDFEIPEQVIYDEDGRKVTVTGYSEGWIGPDITVRIENNTDAPFTVQTRDSSVNGIMIDTEASIRIEAGETEEDEISIISSYLEQNGIEQIADIELSLLFLDSDTYDTLVKTAPIHIETSLSGVYEQNIDDSGVEVYNENGIRIVYQGLQEDDLFGSEPLLYIENGLEQEIVVQLRNTSVNGFMIDPVFSAEVMPDKVAREGVMFSSSELENLGITNITEMETCFEIFDYDTFDIIAQSDAVSIQIGDADDSNDYAETAGDVLYDDNGVRIISQGLKDDTIWGAEPVFCIENNTDIEICVQMRDTTINGIEEMPVFSVDVMPGKSSVDSAVLFDSVIEETGELESMTTSFHIFDNTTYETIVDTEPVDIVF